jgi:hypothetical protein
VGAEDCARGEAQARREGRAGHGGRSVLDGEARVGERREEF